METRLIASKMSQFIGLRVRDQVVYYMSGAGKSAILVKITRRS